MAEFLLQRQATAEFLLEKQANKGFTPAGTILFHVYVCNLIIVPSISICKSFRAAHWQNAIFAKRKFV
jgi:hypothetical protein